VAAGPSLVMLSGVVLVGLLIVACVSDLRSRRIPNILVLIVAAAGLVFATVTKPWLSGLSGASLGLLTGLGIWLPFYAFRMLGAGDVKLFAAASTFLGPSMAVEAAFYTAFFGGALALLWMILTSGFVSTFLRLGHAVHGPGVLRNESTARSRRMPYAFAIAAGIMTAMFWPGHLLS
jgi:prepilin peptidase CpaA